MKYSVVTPLWQDQPPTDNIEVAVNADKLGYEELWIGEMATYDAFSFATAVGLKTGRIEMTVGPLAVSVRTPVTMAMGVASVKALTGRQVNLAIGASSTVVVEQWHGQPHRRTATHIDETAQILKGLLAGEKVKHAGELASCHGYHLRLNAAGGPLTIAAFAPAAVRAAARRADRMLLNMVTPSSLAALRQQLDAECAVQGKDKIRLAVWLCCAVDPQPADFAQMRQAMVGYLSAPGYAEMITEAGFGELVEFARTRPHPQEVFAALPDELIQATGLVATQAGIDAKLALYEQAGADEICLVPATAADPGALKTLTAMQSVAA